MNSLTIRISHDHIVFCTYDRLSNLLPQYEVYDNNPDISLNANIHQAVKTVELAQGDYNFVDAYVCEATTLVPLKEFEEDDIEDIYYLNFPQMRQRCKVFYDTLPYLNALLLFAVDKDVCRTLRDYYPQVKFHNTLTSLVLQYASRYPFSATQPRLYCYVNEQNLTLIVVQGGQLQFMNSFKIHNPSDSLYYIACVANSFALTAAGEKIYVGGDQPAAQNLTLALDRIHLRGFYMDDKEELSQHPIASVAAFPYDLKVLLLKAF